MTIVSLSTIQIAKILNGDFLNINSKILLRDKMFQINVAIIDIPSENNPHYHITSLLTFAVWPEMALIEITPYKNKLFWVKNLEFHSADKLKISSNQIMPLQDLQKALLFQHKQYVTFLFPSLFIELFASPYCFLYTESILLPPKIESLNVQNIAFVYDPHHFVNSYKEVTLLSKKIKETFPSIEISLFSYPLSETQMNNLIYNFDIIHFSGHIDTKGLQIDNNVYYTPHNIVIRSIKTKFLFLNGCSLEDLLLQQFIKIRIHNILFFKEDQIDLLVNIDLLLSFYLGFFLGYRLGGLITIFKNKKVRLFGWAHNSFKIKQKK